LFTSEKNGKAALGEEDKREEQQVDGSGEQEALPPVVGDIGLAGQVFKAVVEYADEDAVEAEDDHRADGDGGDESQAQTVEASAEVDDRVDGEQVDNIEEEDVEHKPALMEMPIEEEKAEQQGRQADGKVAVETDRLQATCLAEEATHEEEAQTAHEAVEGDIGSEVVVLVGSVESDAE